MVEEVVCRLFRRASVDRNVLDASGTRLFLRLNGTQYAKAFGTPGSDALWPPCAFMT